MEFLLLFRKFGCPVILNRLLFERIRTDLTPHCPTYIGEDPMKVDALNIAPTLRAGHALVLSKVPIYARATEPVTFGM